MTDTPYLIAHVVRGEPAFDIAIRQPCPECEAGAGCDECEGEGYWWIVSTSGHRARPYETWYLPDLRMPSFDGEDMDFPWKVGPPPSGWPDHYPINRAPPEAKAEGRSLLAKLGLVKAKEPIRRRV
jgi:hypothetical protein